VPPPHSTSSSPPPGGDVIAAAVIAVIYLCCSGLTITLPTEDEENQFHSTHDTAWVAGRRRMERPRSAPRLNPQCTTARDMRQPSACMSVA
jgi:hypothetical protein